MSVHKEFNAHTGAMETWHYNGDGSFTIQETFDVTSVLETNKKMANATLDQRFGDGMMHHVAEIPNAFIYKFKKEHNLDIFSSDPSDQKRLRRLLELPEYSFLKSTTKKLWRPT